MIEQDQESVGASATDLASAATRFRIIYHAAPFPDVSGQLQTPDPVDLGSDVELALAWMRRRLSLREGAPLHRFVNREIEIAASETPVTAIAEPASVEADTDEALEAWDAEQSAEPLDALADFEDEFAVAGEDPVPALDDDDDPLAGLDDLSMSGRPR